MDEDKETNIVEQKYWDISYETVVPSVINKNDLIRVWIEKYIPKTCNQESCIEIGCYPGQYLSVFGELGYEINGIDLTPKVNTLQPWFEKNGFHVGDFWQKNFLTHVFRRRYDVVFSVGFVEHFTNYQDIIRKHCKLVEKNGFCFIAVPNFLGSFQNWFHRTFDLLNYQRHYIPSMHINSWLPIFEEEGFSIQYSGYFGNFGFWTGVEIKNYWKNVFISMFAGRTEKSCAQESRDGSPFYFKTV